MRLTDLAPKAKLRGMGMQHSDLWRGTWTTRARIASGLVLFAYAAGHLLNIALGLYSEAVMNTAQDWRQVLTRSALGSFIIYTALATHAGLALTRLIERRSLRMPFTEALQYIFGFAIPLLLVTHVTYTRVAHEVFDVNDEMSLLMYLIWGTQSALTQTLLVLVVWVHGCIGLHMWLRGKRWWQQFIPALTGVAVLVPAAALAAFMVQGQTLRTAVAADADLHLDILDDYNLPGPGEFAWLEGVESGVYWAFVALLAAAISVHLGLRLRAWGRSVRIAYVDGPEITAPKGLTLLEMSRSAGVPHTSLCGGRGRCTTCRVVIEAGAEHLHPPEPAEARSLAAVGAAPGTRLACQIRPTDPATVFRVFRPDGRQGRAHASQGQERPLAILFLDMRGFTARTAGQLPYDVVFLLNRFFDAVVPAVIAAGGTIDKYMGDGFLALFETPDSQSSARAGLAAAAGIGRALDAFNAGLTTEGAPPVGIGIGLHLGDVVLGEIGAAGHAPRTLIGDAVNTASRLEGQTKPLGVELLISKAVFEAAQYTVDPAHVQTLELRGVAEPVDVLAVKKARDAPQGDA